MHDPVAVALKRRPHRAVGLGLVAQRRVGRRRRLPEVLRLPGANPLLERHRRLGRHPLKPSRRSWFPAPARRRPAPRRAARAARGTASSRRSRARARGRTRPSPGRRRARRRSRASGPACASRPRSTAIRIRSPTPGSSSVSNGLRSRIPSLEVARQELALGVVAREPERGLREVVRAEGEEVGVPRRSRRRAGTRAAARSSSRRGTATSRPAPRRLVAARTVSSRSRRSSSAKPTSGCMISTSGARPPLATAAAARTIARTCIS